MQDFIGKSQLMDLHTTTPGWTWHNNTLGQARIFAKLDRVLCNTSWLSLMPTSFYETLSHSTSDHKPIILHLFPPTRQCPKAFKYFTAWQLMEGYRDLVHTV